MPIARQAATKLARLIGIVLIVSFLTFSLTKMLPGSLIPAQDPNSSAQYLLILGYDYQPCFRPESLGQ